MRIIVVIFAVGLALGARAVDWRNLDEEHQLGGRKVSSGYVQGKVVLVCRDMSKATRMESVWTSFKSKPFVLIGSYPVKHASSSYPMCSEAGLANGEPSTNLYVVDETGRVVYSGNDENKAIEEVVTALTDMGSPRSLSQWRRFLEYEFKHLPGQAYSRLNLFRKKFPTEVNGYSTQIVALSQVPDIKKLGALVSLAATIKDTATKSATERRALSTKIGEAIRKYSALKESTDPRAAQEAKNAIADLKWTKATL